MADVVTAVEAVAEATAPVAPIAPMIDPGSLDYKKVAVYALAGIGVAACGYAAYRIIKKRKADKVTVEVNPEQVEETEEVVETPEPAKTKKK